ncbi:MAG: dTDP-4-dehydrorhamnose 3,5-epimerase [Ramlibacter sp.]|jgi:dTDP-4-dehydrorhamnose 3,5-epimerase|nr:dTDP-4-dehydrorhamnose 3,5-epimerase [Ramlibacter sp.]MDB5912305.1 dTDP-4-dehydrorhamnose 3,5-epimerase [Ramlibacter sp.]
MKAVATQLPEVLVLEPQVFGDARGFFFESFNQKVFEDVVGVHEKFVQDNHSRSTRGVLRGLHYQLHQTQGKLVRAARGAIFDVAVDIRRSSPRFGHWAGTELTEHNQRQMWVPRGFAHGFLVVSESADVLYKTTDYYAPEYERCIMWNDPAIGVQWPAEGLLPKLSEKDKRGVALHDAQLFP